MMKQFNNLNQNIKIDNIQTCKNNKQNIGNKYIEASETRYFSNRKDRVLLKDKKLSLPDHGGNNKHNLSLTNTITTSFTYQTNSGINQIQQQSVRFARHTTSFNNLASLDTTTTTTTTTTTRTSTTLGHQPSYGAASHFFEEGIYMSDDSDTSSKSPSSMIKEICVERKRRFSDSHETVNVNDTEHRRVKKGIREKVLTFCDRQKEEICCVE
eukprot:UN28588